MVDIRQLRNEVDALYEKLGKLNHYELLGVGRSASEEEIKKVFREKAKRFHNDSYGGLDLGDLRPRMTRIFGEISKAHAVLSNKAQRDEYDARLSLEERGVPTDIRVIFEAEESFRAGKRFLERGSNKEASSKFKEAVRLNRSEPGFRAYDLWTDYCLIDSDPKNTRAKSDIDRIKTALRELVEASPKCSPAHVFIGNIARNEGDTQEAAARYQRALEADKDNNEARSNLRLLTMRRQAEKKKAAEGGFFSKLFRK